MRVACSGNIAGIEPVNAALERICRKWDAAWLRAGVQRIPADFQTGQPEASGGREENFRVGLAFVVMAQTGNRRHGNVFRFCRMLLGEDAESSARSGFEQDGVSGLPERLQCLMKARGVICVACPVLRVGGFGGGDPPACDIRDERNARGAEADLAHLPGKCGHDRVEQPRVERVRILHGPVHHIAGGERAREFLHGSGRPRDHAQVRAVDQSEREVASEQRPQFGFRQCHREHPCGRELRDQLRPPHDQAQRIF